MGRPYLSASGGPIAVHFGNPTWTTRREPFPSWLMVAEGSAPSRVFYGAPNTGAPFTAPGRSAQTPPLIKERVKAEKEATLPPFWAPLVLLLAY